MHIEVRYFEGRVTVGGNPALSMFCRDCRRGAIDFGLLTWFHHPDFARTDDFAPTSRASWIWSTAETCRS
jgi:hypothetical protein